MQESNKSIGQLSMGEAADFLGVSRNWLNKMMRLRDGGDLFTRKIGVNDAARFLGLSASTLNKLRLTGNGPPYLKLGRRVLYDIRDLEAWVAGRKRSHTSEQF